MSIMRNIYSTKIKSLVNLRHLFLGTDTADFSQLQFYLKNNYGFTVAFFMKKKVE